MENNDILKALAISLALTLIFEISFFLAIGKRNKKDLLLVVLVNTLTNPIVVLLYWIIYFNTNWNILLILILLELFAIGTEGFIYRKNAKTINRPFLFSIAANIISFSLGFIIQHFIL